MGKPPRANRADAPCTKFRSCEVTLRFSLDVQTFELQNFKTYKLRAGRERTLGSETSQYQEEKRKIFYSRSSGERNGKSPNRVQHIV